MGLVQYLGKIIIYMHMCEGRVLPSMHGSFLHENLCCTRNFSHVVSFVVRERAGSLRLRLVMCR